MIRMLHFLEEIRERKRGNVCVRESCHADAARLRPAKDNKDKRLRME